MIYEPSSIKDIIGQDLVKTCLISMVKRPSEAPKMIVVSGPYGTGRKTLIKNYIRSLYCENKEEGYSNCGTCEVCRNILNNSDVYREYDCSQIKSIEYSNYIMITNFERVLREDQAYLYNWFNAQDKVPTVFIVTETTDNLIDNIYNLSLILRTSELTKEEIVNDIKEKSERLNLDISDDVIETISRRSRGHLSEAHRMLEIYSKLDKETFSQMIKSARDLYIAFLISSYRDNRDDVDKYITQLKAIPLAYLKVDYEALIVEIMKVATKFEEPKDKLMQLLIKEIKAKALDLYYVLNDKIIYNSFINDDTFQAAMYVIYLKLNNRIR